MKKRFTTLNRIVYFSDRCAAQYKNCTNFVNLGNHESNFGSSAEWNFFATSYGKGPCDGVGGVLYWQASSHTTNAEMRNYQVFFKRWKK